MAKKFLKLNLEPTESQIEVAVDSYASEVGVLIDGSAATSEEIKTDIQNLTDAANAKTGKSDTTLTDAVNTLLEGYGQGDGGGDIIEVDELPTENIDETALYKYADSYYEYRNLPFSDLIILFYGTVLVFSELAATEGYECSFNIIPTKTTENIKVTNVQSSWHWYYVQDENDVLFYGDVEGTGTNSWSSCGVMGFGSFGGFISDVSEATGEGYYAIGYTGFVNYIVPTGSVTITENSIVDVTDKKSVIVDVPEPSGTRYIYENGTWDVLTYKNVVVEVPQPYGTKTISENGTHDVNDYSNAEVKVPAVSIVKSYADLPANAPIGSIVYVLGGE